MTATYGAHSDVGDEEQTAWLVCMGPDKQIYAYVQETNRFHYSYPLDMDHRWDLDFTYTEISAFHAAKLINEGVGLPPGLRKGALQRLVGSGTSLSVDEALGNAAAAIVRHGERTGEERTEPTES